MGEKQQWSNEHLKCLLETCIDEVNNKGRKGLSLHIESWKQLAKVLKEKFDMDLSQKQMKNAYDNLKHKYIGWVYLTNKTGNLYNAQTNTFTLSNEEWEDFKKGHPKAASLKTVPLPFPDLCSKLFGGKTATGNRKWTLTQTSATASSSCHPVQPLLLKDTNLQDNEDDTDSKKEVLDGILERKKEKDDLVITGLKKKNMAKDLKTYSADHNYITNPALLDQVLTIKSQIAEGYGWKKYWE